MSLQITFYSGVGTVTGANFLLESLKTRLLIDCGLIQGTTDAVSENKKPFPYDPKSVNFLFITHAHMDHIGRVPKLVKDGFQGVIYSTPETKELAQVMLEDALKVMKDNMSRARLDRSSRALDSMLYEDDDLAKTFTLWRTIPYRTQTQIGEGFSVNLLDAGHILGAAMYEFIANAELTQNYADKTQKSIKIVFTGDSGNSPSPLLRDTEKLSSADYLVVDSVYGDRNHEPKEERDERFRKIIVDTIEKKGALVIPAFSIERTQVILYELNNLIEDKKIPSVPVFLDSPLALKVTEIYERFTKDFNKNVQSEMKSGDDIFNFPKLDIVHSRQDSENIINTPNPKIIIAGSGTSSGGRVVGHEAHFLPDPNSTLLLMGFQAIGTLGRLLQEKPNSVEINGSLIPVKARIEMISGYSSHKDSDHLVEMVADSVNPDAPTRNVGGRGADQKRRLKVFVVMGEPKSSMYLVQRLREELEVDAVYPEKNKAYKLGF